MAKYNQKETLYLQAKELYYKGFPIMSDEEFDALEDELKNENSEVVTIVGYQNNLEFKYHHLSPMLSLDKCKVLIDGQYPIDDILYFFTNHGYNFPYYQADPKFDGASCSLQYENGELQLAVTRGDKVKGENITPKMKLIVPNKISDKRKIEIRGEVLVPKDVFAQKYASKYANERNMVPGILGADEVQKDIIKDFHFMSYEAKYQDGNEMVHMNYTIDFLKNEGFLTPVCKIFKSIKDEFSDVYEFFKDYRENHSPYRLDGIVLKAREDKRNDIGETSHHPKWALAIKFPPKEAKTTVSGLSQRLGITGEITFVAQLVPVELDGTMVSNVSVTNFGNVVKNKLLPGAEVVIVKSGDIIPYIKEVKSPSTEKFSDYIIRECPVCKTKLVVKDNIHLICPNQNCEGKTINRLHYGVGTFGFRNVGGSTVNKLYAAGIKNIIDLFDQSKFNETALIQSGEFVKGRALEIIMDSIKSLKETTLSTVICALKFDGIGWTMAEQISRKLEGKSYSYNGLSREPLKPFDDPNSEEIKTINRFKDVLAQAGIKIIEEVEPEVNDKTIFFEMTGSPKDFGYSKKEDFLSEMAACNCIHHKLDKECHYLVTDSLSSTSSKMDKAKKLNVKVVTYADFVTIAKNNK